LPPSAVISCARSSALALISANQRCKICERCFAGRVRQDGKAASAAAMARRVSAAPQFATSASSEPPAGSRTAKVAPSSAAIHFPPKKTVDRNNA